MAQVLKDQIRENILNAGLEEFYVHGYVRATIRGIADRAGIPAGLLYSYYKNKEALFDEILRPVCFDWKRVMKDERSSDHRGYQYLSQMEEDCIRSLFRHRKQFIIMMDKSTKTKYEGEKERLVSEIEHHLNSHRDLLSHYDPVFVHIIANNFVDALLQTAYHYESEEWAMELLNKISNMYLQGIGF
ncbi:TetR/AcrR family transcriptional regulator [Anaerostipes sp.]|uniref:TetR/AcrR family transcriptional regulator n=1 Tax=Anaerostipes sp. TaxID=1872530 RepID=UPI0025C35A37|nr:TetR/AcrR family transcriptional regulator [Anaerostipes sp.]MBS7007376.1 TetR/AcrR family transcriptional regulator [Anaerostipes sp.]